jgi:PPP family 3-phenylpropionic acid transporter
MSNALTGGIYTRLSAYYFHFYAVLGLMLPFFGLWMAERGLTAAQIGAVLAAHGLTRIVLPPLWAAWADARGQRLAVIQWASLACAVGLLLLPAAQSFWAVLGAVLLFSVFWNATMPQFEAYTLGQLAHRGGDYSRIRLWGSVGFVLAVVGGGAAFDRWDLQPLPLAMALLVVGMALATRGLPADHPVPRPAQRGSIFATLRRPVVLALLAACMLHQFSFAPYYGFFSLYLEQQGWGKTSTGLLWAFGVICEIVMFIWTGSVIRRFGLRRIFLFAMLTTVARWSLLEWTVDWLPGLLLLQALHLSSFGLYHAAGVQLIYREFEPHQRGRGQALYVSLSFGVGGSLGSAAAGGLWDWAGPDWAYRMAAMAAMGASILAWRWVR